MITFRHLNHNGVGNPSIHTIGKFELEGKEELDVFNPFFRFSKDVSISYLRYMFTFADKETGEEFYYGNVLVKPVRYEQRVHLSLPLKADNPVSSGLWR